MRGQLCLFCHPPTPEACQCDVFPLDRPGARIPDYHWHLVHALLELLWQQAIEECDEWILGPADARPSTPRLRWWENPELVPHLERHPTLTGLLRSNKGCQAVYDWAGVANSEALAFEYHLIGWIDEVIARKLEVKEPTVRQWYANAESRIRTAMALTDFET